MTFKEAKQAIKDLANGEYYSVRFECTQYADGNEKVQCSAYVADAGWTPDFPDYEMMIGAMGYMIEQKNNPAKKEEMFPE